MVWYSHLFQNFPQFIVIHTVKGFGIVNKAEIDVFLELSCFFDDPAAAAAAAKSLQSCSTLCDPIDGSPPGSSVHGISQVRILEWVAIYSRIDYAKAFDCVDHSKLWKLLKEMGIPNHLTCLLRNL